MADKGYLNIIKHDTTKRYILQSYVTKKGNVTKTPRISGLENLREVKESSLSALENTSEEEIIIKSKTVNGYKKNYSAIPDSQLSQIKTFLKNNKKSIEFLIEKPTEKSTTPPIKMPQRRKSNSHKNTVQ